MIDILLPAIYVGVIALLLGGVLAVVSVIFKVETDERAEKITQTLPGANCGGCGYTGCSAYADAIISGGAPLNLCPVGGKAVYEEIADIMGAKVEAFVEKKAFVRCSGDCEKASLKFEYVGIQDCSAAQRVSGGRKSCPNGCLGFGTCLKACKFGAIKMENSIAYVDREKCTGCGSCAKACPRAIIEMVPADNPSAVACNSRDKGAEVRKHCKAGCLGCGICAKTCEENAIEIIENLAKIDYNKCTGCMKCVEKCPAKCIVNILMPNRI